MKQIITLSGFHEAFIRMYREENFSWEARESLFEYFEEVDENMELDVIAICCTYCEDNANTIIREYGLVDDVEGMSKEEREEFVQEYLLDNTSLVGKTSSGFVYAAF